MGNTLSASEAERRYSRFVDEATLAMIDSLDEGDRAYFWTYMGETMPRRLAKSILDEMEREISEEIKRGTISKPEEPEAMPFRYAEDRMRPSSWFRQSYIQ